MPIETAEMLYHAHAILEKKDIGPEDLAHLSELAHDGKYSKEVSRYEQHVVPTLSDFAEGSAFVVAELEKTLESADSEEAKNLQAMINFFKGRSAQVRHAVFSYADSVARFHRIRSRQAEMEVEDFKDLITTVDRDRKRRHDALLTTLNLFSSKVQALIDDGYIEAGDVSWLDFKHMDVLEDVEATQPISHKKITAFSPASLEDRDRIKQWAVALDLVENINEQNQILAAKEKERS